LLSHIIVFRFQAELNAVEVGFVWFRLLSDVNNVRLDCALIAIAGRQLTTEAHVIQGEGQLHAAFECDHCSIDCMYSS